MIRLRDQIANFSVKSELHNELLWIVQDQPVIMDYMSLSDPLNLLDPVWSTKESLFGFIFK